jgi:hypothetical protein
MLMVLDDASAQQGSGNREIAVADVWKDTASRSLEGVALRICKGTRTSAGANF